MRIGIVGSGLTAWAVAWTAYHVFRNPIMVVVGCREPADVDPRFLSFTEAHRAPRTELFGWLHSVLPPRKQIRRMIGRWDLYCARLGIPDPPARFLEDDEERIGWLASDLWKLSGWPPGTIRRFGPLRGAEQILEFRRREGLDLVVVTVSPSGDWPPASCIRSMRWCIPVADPALRADLLRWESRASRFPRNGVGQVVHYIGDPKAVLVKYILWQEWDGTVHVWTETLDWGLARESSVGMVKPVLEASCPSPPDPIDPRIVCIGPAAEGRPCTLADVFDRALEVFF